MATLRQPRYLSANAYFQKRFGTKIYKLALDGGMTCPNRDGTCGIGGCIFCSSGGSGEFAEPMRESVSKQIEFAKRRVAKKAGKEPRYIAYFQSYTNTYAPVEYLREIFTEAISHDDVVGLSVGTRPDCLPEEVVALLGELNRVKPVFAELGLQTSNAETARLIRRGYELPVYDKAVRDLHAQGIHVITHIIFGLPGECREDMMATVRHAAVQGTDGVKIQVLQILKDTALAAWWEAGKCTPLSREEYFSLLAEALELLPPHVVVYRVTGDPPRKLLLAPAWTTDKKGNMNTLNQYLETRDIYQGAKK